MTIRYFWSYTIPKYLRLIFSLLISGIGIGWLIGLAVSPVLSIVITTITGLATAVITVLSGLDEKSKWSVDPLPVSLLILGIGFGSMLGVTARNNDWLGTDISIEAQKWISYGLKMPPDEIVKRLFDARYPPGAAAATAPRDVYGSGTILFDVKVETCNALRGKSGDDLRLELESSTDTHLQALAQIVSNPDELEQLTEQVLCTGD